MQAIIERLADFIQREELMGVVDLKSTRVEDEEGHLDEVQVWWHRQVIASERVSLGQGAVSVQDLVNAGYGHG